MNAYLCVILQCLFFYKLCLSLYDCVCCTSVAPSLTKLIQQAMLHNRLAGISDLLTQQLCHISNDRHCTLPFMTAQETVRRGLVLLRRLQQGLAGTEWQGGGGAQPA